MPTKLLSRSRIGCWCLSFISRLLHLLQRNTIKSLYLLNGPPLFCRRSSSSCVRCNLPGVRRLRASQLRPVFSFGAVVAPHLTASTVYLTFLDGVALHPPPGSLCVSRDLPHASTLCSPRSDSFLWVYFYPSLSLCLSPFPPQSPVISAVLMNVMIEHRQKPCERAGEKQRVGRSAEDVRRLFCGVLAFYSVLRLASPHLTVPLRSQLRPVVSSRVCLGDLLRSWSVNPFVRVEVRL